ncbi:hypothetical protein J2Y55_004588 [Bosea sp. BE125]|uniref:hypothetical protein n=1 Tax=Bosea sp. BE125 TaxID=2817909 RepID=UPI00285C8249|nr:hypothetical protein [Bosea sp. BE125]MDR6873561.1 hypothetical protein [Bosea sp. BE125]
MKKNVVLDALYPDRSSKWTFSWKRTQERSIDLKNFSFIDNPIETIRILHEIAEAESHCGRLAINFEDEYIQDISPYMVFGLIHSSMLPVVVGGRIRNSLREVIKSVDLDKFLGVHPLGKTPTGAVYPFKLRTRRPSGKSRRDNISFSATSEEKVAEDFTDTINKWLGQLDHPLELNQLGKSNILTLLGEALDNAKRHSDPVTADGSWAIAGFMEARYRDDGTITFVCHLAIISTGATIFESLQRAPEDTQAAIDRYVARHRVSSLASSRQTEESLWTVISLQDGISRIPTSDAGSPGGFGMMMVVEMINALNQSPHPDEKPRLTILSGASCIMVRDEHRMFSKSEGGHRVLAFNAANQLDQPPDDKYVFALPHRFPGTIVALRFYLDPSEIPRSRKKDATDA